MADQQSRDSQLKELDRQIEATKARLETTAQPKDEALSWWTTQNAMTISSVVLIFGLLIVCMASLSIRAGRSGESVLRLYGTLLVIISSVFLVVAGYSDQQIAPVMGLLGTIVGYLLGKESRASDKPEQIPPIEKPPVVPQ